MWKRNQFGGKPLLGIALQTGTHVGLSRLTVQRGKLNKAIKILPMPLSSWCTDFILMIMPEDISSVGTAELPTF